MPVQLLERIQALDDSRPNIPGEHWVALGAGLALWLATRRHPSIAVRVLASIASSLLVVRATTGRDVPQPLAKLPYARTPRTRHDWIG